MCLPLACEGRNAEARWIREPRTPNDRTNGINEAGHRSGRSGTMERGYFHRSQIAHHTRPSVSTAQQKVPESRLSGTIGLSDCNTRSVDHKHPQLWHYG